MSSAAAQHAQPTEPVPLPGPGEETLPPHLERWEEVWAASRVPKAGARRGCGPRRQRAGCFPGPPDGREQRETCSREEN